jgi:transposase
LRGEDSIAALCRREGIVQNLYYRWSKEFLETGKKRLAGDTARAAHPARRKLYDVFESTRSPIAEEALKRIGELYKIEAEITGQPAETRLAVRRNRAAGATG